MERVIFGSSVCDFVTAWYGHDEIEGGGAGDYLYGGPGGDMISGGPGNDFIAGGCHGYVCGGLGDSLWGEAGNDIIGADNGYFSVLRGGDGFDRCYYDAGDDIGHGWEVKIKDGVLQ